MSGFSPVDEIKSIQKEFINRKEFLTIFDNIRTTMSAKRPKSIHHFWGIGGIGKSTLKEHLVNILRKENLSKEIWVDLSFEFEEHRKPDNFLFAIRQQLGQKGFKFIVFDFSYACYWKKAYKPSKLNEQLTDLEDSAAICEILSFFGSLPFLDVIPNIIKIAMKMKGFLEEWWNKEAKPFMEAFASLDSTTKMLEFLPAALSIDILSNLRNSKKNLFIFVDTYEAQWAETRQKRDQYYHSRDKWFRKLVKPTLEGVNWLTFGRNRLEWEKIPNEEESIFWPSVLEQHSMGYFSPEDSEKFLYAARIEEDSIIKHIALMSKGLPMYLQLACDIYFRIKNNLQREAEISDFPTSLSDLFTLFVKYLNDPNEREILLLLGIARKWDRSIFELLIDTFTIPFSKSRYKELLTFSFIIQLPHEYYTIHDVIKDHFHAYMKENDPYLLTKLHGVLINHFQSQINVSHPSDLTPAVLEAIDGVIYHQQQMNVTLAIEWLKTIESLLFTAGHIQFLHTTSLLLASLELPASLRLEMIELMSRTGIVLGLLAETQITLEELLSSPEFQEFKSQPMHIKCLNLLGDIYSTQGNYEAAIKIYQEVIDFATNIDNTQLLADVYNDIGEIQIIKDGYSEARNSFELALSYAKLDNNPELISRSLLNIGEIDYHKCNYNQALDYYREAHKIAEDLGDRIQESDALNRIGDVYLSWSRYPEALKAYEKSFVIARQVRNRKQEQEALLSLGSVKFQLDHYLEALDYFNASLKICRERGDRNNEADVLIQIGRVHSMWDRNDEALDHYYKSLQIFQEEEDRAGQAVVLHSIGLLYFAQDRNENALETFNKALLITRNLEKKDLEGELLLAIGEIVCHNNKFEEALDYYQLALTIFKKLEDPSLEASTLSSIGLSLFYQDRYQEALECFNKSLKISKKLEERYREADLLENIGLVYFQLGKYEDAFQKYKTSIEIYKELETRYEQGSVLKNIGDIMFTYFEKYAEAKEYFQKAIEIAKETESRFLEGWTLQELGKVISKEREYNKALNVYKDALTISKDIGDEHLECWVLAKIAEVDYKLGRLDQSLDSLNNLLIKLKTIHDKELESRILLQIGDISYLKTNYEKAFEYYTQSYDITSKIGYKYGQIQACFRYGKIYEQRKDFNEAIKWYTQGRDLSQEIGVQSLIEEAIHALEQIKHR